jgi:hypothetical protein
MNSYKLSDAKLLAFYLPQFHPVPENDSWWGKGFTEWTNVTKAKPLFQGHRQPRFPADLGYYDLRVPEVREQQSALAKSHGIDGFIYYHYWFGNGKRLLERPFDEVLNSEKPDFPFCLCWANQTWSGIWHGSPQKVLIKQEYPGKKDNEQHFKFLFKAFSDQRYIYVDGKPLFIVYDVKDLPNPKEFAGSIKDSAIKAGFKGIYLMAANIVSDDWDIVGNGFDGKISNAYNKSLNKIMYQSKDIKSIFSKIASNVFKESRFSLKVFDHRKLVEETRFIKGNSDTYPIVVPNWDNTPRSGKRGVVLLNSSAELLEKQLQGSLKFLSDQSLPEKLIFIKSWNEWAEGNYLEPDTHDGYKYLETIKKMKLQGSKPILTPVVQ